MKRPPKNKAHTHTKKYYAYLHWLHVEYFGDTALHNQKVWIIHIHLNGTKQIDNLLGEYGLAVDKIFIFAAAANNYLPRHSDFAAIFITNRTIMRIGIVEYDRHRCFRNTSLAILENQFLH